MTNLGEGNIHPMAVVAKGAKLGKGVRVGPFAVVGENVEIGDRAVIHPHAVIDGHTTLGNEVKVFPGAAIGLEPQDRKYDGSPTKLVIGDRTVLRECCTLQRYDQDWRGDNNRWIRLFDNGLLSRCS